MGKANRQKKHFKRRFRERLGVYLSDHDIDSIIKEIEVGHARILERESNRVSKFEVSHNNENYIVVYDRLRRMPVTVITETMSKFINGELGL